LISLAGPAAGFLLAALTLLAIQAAGHDALLFLRSLMTRRPVSLVVNDSVTDLVASLLYVNVYWGLLNLLPIFPLDGGRVARELLLAKSHDGVRQSLMLSFVTAVVVAALALLRWQQTYVAIMFGFMAYSNYTQLSGPFGGSFGGPGRYRPW
jgi:Zn-dependent protease